MRKRTVGKEVIDRMLKRFQAPYFDEGIHDIKVILPDEFDIKEYENLYFNGMHISHDNPHHTSDIYHHCVSAALYASAHNFNSDLKIAAIYHDIGKPYVKAFVDSKGNPCETAHYYQHQCVGAWIAYGLMVDPFVVWLISTHMEPFFNSKYYNKLPTYLKEQVDLLHEADLAAH